MTAPYRFENHPGWAGTAHCGLIDAGDGRYFMVHQGRLSPQNQLMDLHVREVFFTVNGWPVVSPERYAGTAPRSFTKEDLVGEWEIIRIQEPPLERSLEAGQYCGVKGTCEMGSRRYLPVLFWKQMAVLEMQLGILMLKTTSYYKNSHRRY